MVRRRNNAPAVTHGVRNGTLPRGRGVSQPTNIVGVASLVAFIVVFGLLTLVFQLDDTASSEVIAINYHVRLDDEQYHFPVYLSRGNIGIIASHSRKTEWNRVFVDAMVQARPHILGIKSWTCMCCGKRPARTTVGSPAYLKPQPGQKGEPMIWDLTPIAHCGETGCAKEATRRMKELLAASPTVQNMKT